MKEGKRKQRWAQAKPWAVWQGASVSGCSAVSAMQSFLFLLIRCSVACSGAQVSEEERRAEAEKG